MKYFKVSYESQDGVKFSELFAGKSPNEALKNAKESNKRFKNFRVGSTPYNTYGEKA